MFLRYVRDCLVLASLISCAVDNESTINSLEKMEDSGKQLTALQASYLKDIKANIDKIRVEI